MSLALRRLTEERKTFRAQKPFGFYARPSEKPDGSSDMFRWEWYEIFRYLLMML